MKNKERLKFPKSARVSNQLAYSAVFAQRKSLRAKRFVLHYNCHNFDQSTVSTARLGLVVGKRFCKRAVDRNLIKRLGREQFRLQQQKLPGADMVLRLVTNIKGISASQAMRRDIAQEICLLLDQFAFRKPCN